jgi:hypothetical protein
MTLGLVLGDGLFKLLPGKQLQHLAEDAGYSYHGDDFPPYTDYVSQRKPQQSSNPAAQNRQRC